MRRAVAIAVAVLGFGAAVVPAQEVFWDDFEYGDLCAWSNPPIVTYHEQESFDQSGANDDLPVAEQIGRCAIVEGTIGEPYDAVPGPDVMMFADTDFYEVNVTGPALLRVRIERIGIDSEFQASAVVTNEYDGYWEFGITGCDLVAGYPTVTSRQIYIPEDGFVFSEGTMIPNNNKWYVNVDDARNFDTCGLGFTGDFGGVGQTYRLTVSVDPISGPPLTFPYVEEAVQMPADGSLLIYRVDGGSVANLDMVETFSDRVTPGELDTKLFVVAKNGKTYSTLAGNDDFDPNVIHLDSQLLDVSLTAAPHFVIVDNFQKYLDGPVDFGLTINYLQTIWP